MSLVIKIKGIIRNFPLGNELVKVLKGIDLEIERGDYVALPMVYAGASKEERKNRAEKVLTDVGLADRMDHKPSQLSGGQRQRVAVGRALVNKPSIILADEPTGNLDSKTSLEIMGLFDDIHKKGNTVIIVTHEEGIAKYAHRVIRLVDGIVSSDIRNK